MPIPVNISPATIRHLLSVADSALKLEALLRENVGYSDEWPIQIVASTEIDADQAATVAAWLSRLGRALSAMKRDGEAMRQLMAYQIDVYGNPYPDPDPPT